MQNDEGGSYSISMMALTPTQRTALPLVSLSLCDISYTRVCTAFPIVHSLIDALRILH
jgi:hypothetical protein